MSSLIMIINSIWVRQEILLEKKQTTENECSSMTKRRAWQKKSNEEKNLFSIFCAAFVRHQRSHDNKMSRFHSIWNLIFFVMLYYIRFLIWVPFVIYSGLNLAFSSDADNTRKMTGRIEMWAHRKRYELHCGFAWNAVINKVFDEVILDDI